jgi:hypothetical protein
MKGPTMSSDIKSSASAEDNIDHPVDLQAGEPDLAARRRETAEWAGVRTGEQDALRDHPLVG